MSLVLVQPDSHIPKHHRKAVKNFLNLIADLNGDLDELLIIGDLVDFESVSRWSTGTSEEDGRKLQRELDAAYSYLNDVRSVFAGPITFVRGNHEDRMEKYLRTKGQGLRGLHALELTELLAFDDLGVDEMNQPYEVLKDVLAIHGERLGYKSGLSVAKEMDRLGKSVVMGHCHRQAIVYRKTDRVRFGMEVGHFQGQADYISYGADWQLGFGYLRQQNGQVVPHLVPARANGSFVFEGVNYAS